MTNHRLTHYIPPATPLPELPKEFVEPNPSDYFIHWLFKYRCAECKKPGQEVNEILPRARSKFAIMDWKNRILLCRDCHSRFHLKGVTDKKIENMRRVRVDYLTSINREEYV